MAEKSAPPTPTMMTDMGKPEAQIRADLVSCMSESTPSVKSSKTKYCYGGSRWREQRARSMEEGKERGWEEGGERGWEEGGERGWEEGGERGWEEGRERGWKGRRR